MAWFFTDDEIKSTCLVSGEDAKHIEKSLRMRVGEELTLVTPSVEECLCVIKGFCADGVEVEVISRKPCESEADIEVTLYQSLTKGDKMDLIVQKSVELGVSRIVPVVTSRCVSRPDEKSLRKKIERWQKIALGAAQQSCRGCVPLVADVLSFEEALNDAKDKDCAVIFYEGGGESLKFFTEKDNKTYAYNNEEMAFGAIAAMEQAGINVGTDVKVVTIDASKECIQNILDGKIAMTLNYDPHQGNEIFDQIERWLNGEEYELSYILSQTIIDSSNAAEALEKSY